MQIATWLYDLYLIYLHGKPIIHGGFILFLKWKLSILSNELTLTPTREIEVQHFYSVSA